MGAVSTRRGGHTPLHVRIGSPAAELSRLRLGLGMSQADTGKALFVHNDLVRKIETAERMPSDELVQVGIRVRNG
jgi:hypothetical protein